MDDIKVSQRTIVRALFVNQGKNKFFTIAETIACLMAANEGEYTKAEVMLVITSLLRKAHLELIDDRLHVTKKGINSLKLMIPDELLRLLIRLTPSNAQVRELQANGIGSLAELLQIIKSVLEGEDNTQVVEPEIQIGVTRENGKIENLVLTHEQLTELAEDSSLNVHDEKRDELNQLNRFIKYQKAKHEQEMQDRATIVAEED